MSRTTAFREECCWIRTSTFSFPAGLLPGWQTVRRAVGRDLRPSVQLTCREDWGATEGARALERPVIGSVSVAPVMLWLVAEEKGARVDIAGEQIRAALEANPTLRLLNAYSRDWVLPLFADHLERADGSVSAEWFHERIIEALEQIEWDGDVTPSERCRKWIEARWLDTETVDGRLRYLLTEHSLRALEFVRQMVEGETSVSGARLVSISHAVRQLAGMTNPNREAQVKRIDAQIAELEKQKADVEAGRARGATLDEMRQQLREVLTMMRSLPADFRQLRAMVEDRHQLVARHAMVEGPPKAELVEEYLRENDLLARTSQGTSYLGFARMLASRQSDQLRVDIDQILIQEFAREHMTSSERAALDSMLSMLLAAELSVQTSYLRWSESLRRFLTRAAHGRHQHLITLADRTLHAGAEWVEVDPGARQVPSDTLGIGAVDVVDISQTQLWRDHGPENVVVEVFGNGSTLPARDREALRLAAGTSPRALGVAINTLLENRPLVTGSEVFGSLPREFQRLGAVVSLLDLAVQHGQILDGEGDEVAIDAENDRVLFVTIPGIAFSSTVPMKEKV